MYAGSFRRFLWVAVIGFLFASTLTDRAISKEPVNVDGTTRTVPDAKFKASVKRLAKVKDFANGTVAFFAAPSDDVELVMQTTDYDLTVRGTYSRDAKQKLVVVVDEVDLADGLKNLFIDIADDFAVVDNNSVVIQIDKLKFKAADKLGKTEEKVKVAFAVKFIVSATLDSVAVVLPAKVAFKGKFIQPVGTPGDTTAPNFVSSVPADTATAVSVDTSITATFDEAMNPPTLDASTFLVTNGGAVTGTVSYDDATLSATFTPDAPLSSDATYTVTLTPAIADRAGNPLGGAPVSFSFTTTDATAPSVTVRTPVNGATGVARNTNISATFDEDMNATTIDGTTFTIIETISTTPVAAASISYDGPTRTATFTTTADLGPNVEHTVTVTTGAQDAAGNGLAADEVWTFTTGGTADSTPPFVAALSPQDTDTDVSVATHQRVDFSEPMNQGSVQSAISVSPTPANPLQFFWNGTGDTVTVVFDTQGAVGVHADDILVEDTIYTVTVGAAAADLAGNPKGTDDVIAWTTQPDVTPPTITGYTPDITAGPQTFNAASTLTISFDEAMDTVSSWGQVELLHAADNRQANIGDPPGDMNVAWSGNDLVITFNTALLANSVYVIDVDGLLDLAGNGVEGELPLVTPGGQTGAPTLMATVPADGATGVSPDSFLFVGFSRPMGPDLADHVQITGAGSTQVVLETVSDPQGITITPQQAWPASSTITITVTGGVSGASDASGNTLPADASFSFTTAAHSSNAWGVAGDYSSLKDGDTDVATQNFEHTLVFRDSSNNAAFSNLQGFSPDAVTLREQASGIPLKGYSVELDDDGALEISGSGDIAASLSLQTSTTYELTFNASSLTSSTGVPISPSTITFTTHGPNSQPLLYNLPDTEGIETTSSGLTLALDVGLQDFDGDTVTVDVESDVDPAFTRTLTDMGFGSFEYTTGGSDETDITTRSQLNVMTFTVDDGAGHTLTIKRDTFPWAAADLPVPTGPLGSTSNAPLYTYTLSATALAEADVVFVQIEDSGGNVPLFTVLPVPATTSGSFQHPADNPLPPGDYTVFVAVAKFSGNTTRGDFIGLGLGATGSSVDFTVP